MWFGLDVPAGGARCTPPRWSRRFAVEALGTFWLVFIGCGSAIFDAKFVALDPRRTGHRLRHRPPRCRHRLRPGGHDDGVCRGARLRGALQPGRDDRHRRREALRVARGAGLRRRPARRRPAGRRGARRAAVLDGPSRHGQPRGQRLRRPLPRRVRARRRAHRRGPRHRLLRLHHPRRDQGRRPKGFAPLAIGFGLLLAHLVAVPISNASINPARSTAVAFFNGNGAPGQLWAFWVAPIVGGLIAGSTFAWITGERRDDMDISGSTDLAENAASTTRAVRCSTWTPMKVSAPFPEYEDMIFICQI